MEAMPSNCSVIGISLKTDSSGLPSKINFKWEFPYLEEDI
jgi:hypothetical protein